MSLVNGFTAVFLLLAITVTVNSQVDHNKESARRLQELYKIIHNIALPAPLHGGTSTKRLVMMFPGKILTERDYHPGPEYIASISETDPDKYLDIPPIKMQNLFNLVDVVPGVDPLLGQESGKSFSRVYKDILGRMDIKGLKTLAQEQRARQQQSIDFLMEIPERSQDECNAIEDKCVKTRWDLYRYYEEKYNIEKKKMEEEIESKRNSTSGLQYQYWFIRTFPILQANVDGAFMDWLVKGDKDIVELYRSRLDTSSAGTLLLEAKSALRASGFTALDRSQTVYPVNFVPGDWYKFLRDPELKLTADQINLKISFLETRKHILTAMKDYTCELGSAKGTATTQSTKASTAAKENATELMTQRCKCVINGGSGGEGCSQYLSGLAGITSVANSAVIASLSLKGLDGLVGNNEAITDEIDKIDAEMAALGQGGGGYSLPGLANIPIGPQPSPADSWLQFDYDSSQETTEQTSERTSSSFSASFKARFGLFSIGGSASYSKQTQDNFSSFKSEKVKVGGEILRVSVQYPWFRPELFDQKKLAMSDNTKVSPGPYPDDAGFTEEASKDYLLPQYITGLLLCRNLTLEFSNVAKESSYSFVATSLSTSLSVGYGPFSLSASYSRSSQKSSFEASDTATGLRIRVPGVQMIGYYTEVTPIFPKDEF